MSAAAVAGHLEEVPRPSSHVVEVSIDSLRKHHVAIGTPSYGNQFSSQYLSSILRTQSYFAERGLEFSVLLASGASVERTRNQLVSRFLDEPEFTHLMWIDADEGWEAEAVLRLLACGHDVVGVPVHKKKDDPGAWNLNVLEGQTQLVIERGAIEVSAVGTGFTMVSRKALLRMAQAYPELKTAADPDAPEMQNLYGFYSRILTEDKRDLSEDFAFCHRWREIGGRVWIDPDSEIVHVGQREWRGKFTDCIQTTLEYQRVAAEQGDGLFALPSRGRPTNLARFLGAYLATNATARVWVRLDEDDPKLAEYQALSYPEHWIVEIGPTPDRRCVGAVDEMFQKYPNEKFYGLLGDDLLPRTDRWDVHLAKAAGTSRLAFGDDGHNHANLATHPVVGGDLVRAIGWLVLPGVQHSFVDRALHEIAIGADRVQYMPGVVTEHLHPIAGKSKMDETYRFSESYDADKAVFSAWEQIEMPLVIQRVRDALATKKEP